MTLNTSLTKKIHLERLKRLQKWLKQHKCDLCLIDSAVDLLYLTGLKLSAGTLLVDQKKALLLVDGRYVESAKKNSPYPVELQGEHSVRDVVLGSKTKTLGFDSQTTSYDQALKLKKLCKNQVKLLPVPAPLKTIRAVKDAEELKALRKSAQLLWKGHEHIKKILKVGMTEKEVALELEFFCRALGAERMAFETIVAFGVSSAMPHYRAGQTKLKKGDLVLIDSGVVVDGYHSDMTRTLFFGKEDPFLKNWQDIVKRAFDAALALCKPGVSVRALDLAARRVMNKEGVEHYFIHSLGHGVGLEIHEYPRLSAKGEDVRLEEGMVITIEPGLYLPGKGGIRYEDTVIVTKTGHENLYPSSPK